jgi:hypothetical protein
LNPEASNYLLRFVLPFFMYSYSNDFPRLANTGSDQIGLSTNYTVEGNLSRNVLEWFRSPVPLSTEEVLSYIPAIDEDLLDLVNPNMLQLYLMSLEQNVTEPCTPGSNLINEGVIDLLCQTIHDASVWPIIRSITYPLQLCYSANDTLITADNFPPDLFENDLVTLNDEVFPGLGFPISGDHGATIVLCSIGMLRTFTDPSLELLDPPNSRIPLTEEEQVFCRARVSAVISTSPSISPSPYMEDDLIANSSTAEPSISGNTSEPNEESSTSSSGALDPFEWRTAKVIVLIVWIAFVSLGLA